MCKMSALASDLSVGAVAAPLSPLMNKYCIPSTFLLYVLRAYVDFFYLGFLPVIYSSPFVYSSECMIETYFFYL